MNRSPWSLPGWARRYSPMLVNGACLLAAMWLAPRLAAGAGVPVKGIVLALIALVSVRTLAPDGSAGLWRHAALYLPGQISVGIVSLAAGRLVWDWPWAVFFFLPLWLGLTILTWLRFVPWRRVRLAAGILRTILTDAGCRLWKAVKFRVAQGDDTAFTGALIVGGVVFFAGRLAPSLGLDWPSLLSPALLWLAVDRIPLARWQHASDSRSRFARFFGRLVVWAATAGGVVLVMAEGSLRSRLAVLLVSTMALAAFGLSHRHRLVSGAENAARTLLGLFTGVLITPFAVHQLIGSQDAVWYLNTLSDFLAQIRAGVFPVFVGQSEHLFNGGVLPVRFAPLFQHYGLVIDTLTLRSLAPVAVQNAVIMASFVGAAVASGSMLSRMLPDRPWHAAALSALFLTCPGVLAIVYYEDLFMTWTTLPWLPLVFGGCALSFGSPTAWPLLLSGSALGLVWWGHAPVALWTTLAVAAIQLARLLPTPLPKWPWRALLAAAAGFAAIAAYPMISVLAVPVQTGTESLDYTATHPGAIVHFIQDCFPGILIPLFWKDRTLSDFQPGWALLLIFGVCAACLIRQRIRHPGPWALLAVPLGLQLLLLPVPWMSNTLWSLLPGFLVNPTGTWPMQRLYVIIAISGTCAAGFLLGEDRSRRPSPVITLGLLTGLLWSMAATIPLLRAKEEQQRKIAHTTDWTRPENLVLTRYAYLVFNRQPAYYSHGYVDPLYEQRLLSPGTGKQIGGNPDAILAGARVLAEGALTAEIVNPGDPWQITPRFQLAPGKRYALDLRFHQGAEPGVLLLDGRGLNRINALPTYGGSSAFGSGPDSSPLLPLHTSGHEPVEVRLQFVAESTGRGKDYSRFGTYRWLEVDPAALPVRVTGWIPYQAEVEAPAAAWLETPRMFQPGYRAAVNGKVVTPVKSSEGLVAVPVPAGRSSVVLAYEAPTLLRLSYWTSLLAIILSSGLLLVALWRSPDPGSPPP